MSPQFCANRVSRMTIYIVVRQRWSSQRPAKKHAVMGLHQFFQKKDTTSAVHRGAFCQFTFWWIHYYDSNKSTGLETGKLHRYALLYC